MGCLRLEGLRLPSPKKTGAIRAGLPGAQRSVEVRCTYEKLYIFAYLEPKDMLRQDGLTRRFLTLISKNF